MTRQQVLTIVGCLFLASMTLSLVMIVVTVIQARQHRIGPVHPGVTTTTPPPPAPAGFPRHIPATPRPAAQTPVGRHHEDTVHLVPPDWMPRTGAARLRALEATHLDLSRRPGGVA